MSKRAILDLLEDELALVRPEFDARLGDADVRIDGRTYRFDAHILSEALRELVALNAVVIRSHRTRGGNSVDVYLPAEQRRRATAIARQMGRKALLYRRFLALAQTAGEAGELVLRTSLQRAAAQGTPYLPMARRFGEVTDLLGQRPYGAFDSGAYLHSLGSSGVPQLPVALPIEVKNRRLTLYPIHKEVHQLLAKAATIQLAHPTYPVAPVLISRKAHARLFWMAADLGFRVWATQRQYVLATRDIDERKIQELRTELGLVDLTVVDRGSPPRIEKFLVESLPKQARKAADDWAVYAETIAPYAEELRKDVLTPQERQQLVDQLRDSVVELHAQWGIDEPFTWAMSEDHLDEE